MIYTPKKRNVMTETLDLLTVVDGKIVDFLEFCDTHMVARMLERVPG